jgi:hypothetical protein
VAVVVLPELVGALHGDEGPLVQAVGPGPVLLEVPAAEDEGATATAIRLPVGRSLGQQRTGRRRRVVHRSLAARLRKTGNLLTIEEADLEGEDRARPGTRSTAYELRINSLKAQD